MWMSAWYRYHFIHICRHYIFSPSHCLYDFTLSDIRIAFICRRCYDLSLEKKHIDRHPTTTESFEQIHCLCFMNRLCWFQHLRAEKCFIYSSLTLSFDYRVYNVADIWVFFNFVWSLLVRTMIDKYEIFNNQPVFDRETIVSEQKVQ